MTSGRKYFTLGYVVYTFILFVVIIDCDLEDDISPENSNLRFGAGPQHSIEEIEGFPDPKTFFTKYVTASKPVKMTGAAKISPAFHLWSDDYFLTMNIPADSLVLVETKKKENRHQETLQMHFKDFVSSYNTSEQYMVETVPQFLGYDIMLMSCYVMYGALEIGNGKWELPIVNYVR